jgi:hypothetical protein
MDFSTTDIVSLFSVNKYMNSLWYDGPNISFVKDNIVDFKADNSKKNHYFKEDKTNDFYVLQWIFLNENHISQSIDQLSNSIIINFVVPEKRKYNRKNEVHINSQLSVYEIYSILKKLCCLRKNDLINEDALLSSHSHWLLFCARAILLFKINKGCGTNENLQKKHQEISWYLNQMLGSSSVNHYTLREKWNKNLHLSCLPDTHPEAALMYALFLFTRKSLEFYITSKNEELQFYDGDGTNEMPQNINFEERHRRHRNCFKLAIQNGVVGAKELYDEISHTKWYEYLIDLDI